MVGRKTNCGRKSEVWLKRAFLLNNQAINPAKKVRIHSKRERIADDKFLPSLKS
jgi:hypothetical protein